MGLFSFPFCCRRCNSDRTLSALQETSPLRKVFARPHEPPPAASCVPLRLGCHLEVPPGSAYAFLKFFSLGLPTLGLGHGVHGAPTLAVTSTSRAKGRGRSRSTKDYAPVTPGKADRCWRALRIAALSH